MALASVTFSYLGACYTLAGIDATALKGRLGCDCKKAELIQELCDAEFPALKCGAEISIVSVVDAADGADRKTANRTKAQQAGMAS